MEFVIDNVRVALLGSEIWVSRSRQYKEECPLSTIFYLDGTGRKFRRKVCKFPW